MWGSQRPAGYCIDTGNTSDFGAKGGFALVSSCRSLLGVAASPAIITVSIGPKVGASQVSAAAFANALGNPVVLASEEVGAVSLLHIASGRARDFARWGRALLARDPRGFRALGLYGAVCSGWRGRGTGDGEYHSEILGEWPLRSRANGLIRQSHRACAIVDKSEQKSVPLGHSSLGFFVSFLDKVQKRPKKGTARYG